MWTDIRHLSDILFRAPIQVLVLVTGSQTGDMEQLAKQAKKAGVEIVVVSKNMENKFYFQLFQGDYHHFSSDRLSVLAKETLRLEKFSPFILDATSRDTPWLIAAYLKVNWPCDNIEHEDMYQNSQEVHKYATSKWSPPTQGLRTEDEPDLNLDDFDLILKQNCKLNPCCCKKAQEIAREIARRREATKGNLGL